MYKIAIDALGFENDPIEAYYACIECLKIYDNIKFFIVCKEEYIQKFTPHNNIEFIICNDYFNQNDSFLEIRNKKNTSLEVCCNLLNNNVVDAIISACNSSIFVSFLYLNIGLINNVDKLGFMPCIPKVNGNFYMVDVGASLEVDEYDLYKFALMANEFVKTFIPKPIIKTLNIASEEHKGKQLQINVNKLLKANKSIDYQGFIEPNTLLNADCDIVISDALIGNIALKSMEGTAKIIGSEIKKEFKKPKNLFKGLIVKKNLKRISEQFNYKNNAGAVVLGLNKLAIKTHGAADKKQFISSIEMVLKCLKNNFINKIEELFKDE